VPPPKLRPKRRARGPNARLLPTRRRSSLYGTLGRLAGAVVLPDYWCCYSAGPPCRDPPTVAVGGTASLQSVQKRTSWNSFCSTDLVSQPWGGRRMGYVWRRSRPPASPKHLMRQHRDDTVLFVDFFATRFTFSPTTSCSEAPSGTSSPNRLHGR
jgi:hypothetical protein